jgi:hypothetical protein
MDRELKRDLIDYLQNRHGYTYEQAEKTTEDMVEWIDRRGLSSIEVLEEERDIAISERDMAIRRTEDLEERIAAIARKLTNE